MSDKVMSYYELVDPLDTRTYYIGRTKELAVRYKQHVSGKDKSSEVKNHWVLELKAKGELPIMNILETSPITTQEEMNWPERAWIFYHLQKGSPLLNIERLQKRVIALFQSIPYDMREVCQAWKTKLAIEEKRRQLELTVRKELTHENVSALRGYVEETYKQTDMPYIESMYALYQIYIDARYHDLCEVRYPYSGI